MKKQTVCTHCKAVDSHYSFQCSLIRKPIKSKMSTDQIAASKRKVKSNPKTPPKLVAKVKHAIEDKGVSELLKLAEIVFNKWIRNRDKLDDFTFICISCWSAHPLEQMDAGHFRSKTISSLRFNENNINGECQSCNRHDVYHLIGYRENLIYKIGELEVLKLEAIPFGQEHKWSREELLEIIKKYKS